MGSFAKMRALVTGGAGFIGSHIVEALLERGATVAVLDNFVRGQKSNVPSGVELFVDDLQNKEAVFAAYRKFRPTHVFHQAAQASVKVSVDKPAYDAAVNIMGSLHLLDAAKQFGVQRFVFASTGGALYGEVLDGQAATEDWPLLPKSPYGAGKAAFEHYLNVYKETFGLPSTVLRYANVYGPRQDPYGEAGVVAIFASKLLQGEPVTLFARRRAGDEGCIRDYVSVFDVVRANLLAVEKELDGCYNVGTGIGTSTRTLLQTIREIVGVPATVKEAPPRVGDLQRSVVDCSKLRAAGWSAPLSLTEGLQQTVASFRRQLQRTVP